MFSNFCLNGHIPVHRAVNLSPTVSNRNTEQIHRIGKNDEICSVLFDKSLKGSVA